MILRKGKGYGGLKCKRLSSEPPVSAPATTTTIRRRTTTYRQSHFFLKRGTSRLKEEVGGEREECEKEGGRGGDGWMVGGSSVGKSWGYGARNEGS